ncbi:protease modulator HflC [Desulfovibrio subterraneus]|jgi:membrane protease subunit HflC|uniref:Protein HflC n=1 Tax=Desulfovibrio subterraneus TaxID=2718620 RepID=A0A7J0BG82_9BACT|nr:protease modulator HflC [Desulfovibrio subterraneus]WBF66939.1 protease modulator HflC [Desulfovibrio subterraneus]GFM32666.1 protein HflC [Desulfovibrio subterraneus]
MSNRSLTLIIGIFVGLVVVFQSAFTVHQTQNALVLQLGKPVGGVLEPGLHFKLPFVQNVIYFDARVLDYDAQPAEALTKDKKALVLDNYARWRITDPLRFYQTVRTIPGAQARLDDIVYSQLRVFLGRYTLTEVVSSERSAIMEMVTKRSSDLISEYGIEIIDVRIKRTDLPPENQRAIFGRMRAERERQAKQYRSEGQEESTTIKSTADKEQAVILAEARRQASVIRGEGEALSTRVFAEALSKSPEFYEFQRSMEAYKKSFAGKTRILLTTDDQFLKYLK